MTKDLCGIDEAGRGCFAGPLVVAGVVLSNPIDKLQDSKQLSPKKREILFDKIIQSNKYYVVFKTNDQIDKYGLSICIQEALKEIMQNLEAKEYLFDGHLNYNIPNLSCQIKADQTIMQVSAASIVAKVTRDRYMQKISSQYPQYSFDKHKGYGTKLHKEAIRKFGLSNLHRKSVKIKL
jgi:ribonuclease HII